MTTQTGVERSPRTNRGVAVETMIGTLIKRIEKRQARALTDEGQRRYALVVRILRLAAWAMTSPELPSELHSIALGFKVFSNDDVERYAQLHDRHVYAAGTQMDIHLRHVTGVYTPVVVFNQNRSLG